MNEVFYVYHVIIVNKKTVLLHFSSPPKTFPHDINTQSGLTALYNMRVVKATRYERPLQGLSVTLGLLKHSGVVVTLTNGRTYLIHKVIVTILSLVVTYHCQI